MRACGVFGLVVFMYGLVSISLAPHGCEQSAFASLYQQGSFFWSCVLTKSFYLVVWFQSGVSLRKLTWIDGVNMQMDKFNFHPLCHKASLGLHKILLDSWRRSAVGLGVGRNNMLEPRVEVGSRRRKTRSYLAIRHHGWHVSGSRRCLSLCPVSFLHCGSVWRMWAHATPGSTTVGPPNTDFCCVYLEVSSHLSFCWNHQLNLIRVTHPPPAPPFKVHTHTH